MWTLNHGEFSSDCFLLSTEISGVTAQAAEPRVSAASGVRVRRSHCGEGVFLSSFSSPSSVMWSVILPCNQASLSRIQGSCHI